MDQRTEAAPPSQPSGAGSDVPPPRAAPAAEAWSISFAPTRRRTSAKEVQALALNQRRGAAGARSTASAAPPATTDDGVSTPLAASTPESPVDVDALADVSLLVPRGLTTTQADRAQRHHFDVLRWQCVARPQYARGCGVASLTSVWNYLYSRLGPTGTLPPVSQEEVMTILGFEPPFDDIRWGGFTGNTTLMRWFHAINRRFGTTGKASYHWKLHGVGRTVGITPDAARGALWDALRDPCAAVVYHCHNHYMVPIGFTEKPRARVDVYAPSLPPSAVEPSVIIAEVSGTKNVFHVKKWDDVATDIDCQAPYWFNIREAEAGVRKREKCRRPGGNLHCFLLFRSDVAEEDLARFEEGAPTGEDEEDEADEDDEGAGPRSAATGATPT